MNISGNYNTEREEIEIVRELLTEKNIEFVDITKDENRDDSDVIITFDDARKTSVEVKRESASRFNKYGDLGIDFISAFNFIDYKDVDSYKRVPQFFNDPSIFFDKIRILKPGKMEYSKANLWLFYVQDNREVTNSFWFHGFFMTSSSFRQYLYKNCKFVVNHKPASQESHTDEHESAVIFINSKDDQITSNQLNIEEYFAKN